MDPKAANASPALRAPFAAGDVAMLYDRRKRRYRIVLSAGGSFSTHVGTISHDDIIGRTEGFHLATRKKSRLLVLRPTFQEAVLELPRQSQVIYPKDLGAVLLRADLYPGANVLELGLGSGATAAAILRAVGPAGSLHSCEIREGIIEPARRNVAELAPGATNHVIEVRDAYAEPFPGEDLDRVIIDIPEPWRVTSAAADKLRLGGIILCYLPTVLQVHQAVMALTMDTRWRLVETVEVLERPWHVSDQSVRPEHRMVAHTGFIVTARRCEPLPAGEEDDAPASDAASGEVESGGEA